MDKGVNVVLTCLSLGHTYWMFGFGSLIRGSSLSKDHTQLQFDMVQLHHNGRYYCYGCLGKGGHFIAAVEVFVYGKGKYKITATYRFSQTFLIIVVEVSSNKVKNYNNAEM